MVDDSPETLGLLTDTLEEAGFTVLVATDGEHALSIVEQITPDLILMDAVMPGIDGFETCRRLKQNRALAHVPVIFMTGLTETEHIVEGLEAGGVDYVTKPIVLDELLARIRVHLANARMAQSARTALDASGRFLLAVDGAGKVLWCTPQAARLLDAALARLRCRRLRRSGRHPRTGCASAPAMPPASPRRRRSSSSARHRCDCSCSMSARSARTSICCASSKATSAAIRCVLKSG